MTKHEEHSKCKSYFVSSRQWKNSAKGADIEVSQPKL